MVLECLFVGGPLNGTIGQTSDKVNYIDMVEDGKVCRYTFRRVAVIRDHRLKLDVSIAYAPGWE